MVGRDVKVLFEKPGASPARWSANRNTCMRVHMPGPSKIGDVVQVRITDRGPIRWLANRSRCEVVWQIVSRPSFGVFPVMFGIIHSPLADCFALVDNPSN